MSGLDMRRFGVALAAAALSIVAACGSTDSDVGPIGVAGSVVEVQGAVTAERPGAEARALAVGDEIFSDDTIATGADASVTIRLEHNEARWTLGSDRRHAVRESAAWRAPKAAGNDLLGATDRTSAAGRHAEREAAATAATAVEPGSVEGALAFDQEELAAEPEAEPPPPAPAAAPEAPAPKRTKSRSGRAPGSAPPAPADGLGLSGTGEGGGGIGDLGGLGTTGGGAGTGAGYGAGQSSPEPAARVRFADITVTGELDRNIVRRFLRRTQPQLTHCYARALQGQPGLKGAVTARFVIHASGVVAGRVSAEGVSNEVSACVAGALGRITYPAAEGRALVEVRVRLEFSPN